jgi:taurine dioxygenase
VPGDGVRILEPIGVQLDDSRADGLVDVDRLRLLLAEHGVIVLRDQVVDDARFLDFLRSFGSPVFTVGETPVAGFPDLNVVSNVGRSRPPRSVFHVDTSYVGRPPAYTALRAVTVPAVGGQTVFTNQYRAYDTLPQDLREQLAGRSIRHVATGVDPGDAQESAADHPVLRVHPVSGRTALYLSTPARCVAMSGMTDDAAHEMISLLYEHSTRADNCYRHDWRAGDVVMWDNGVVLHKADHDGVVGDRVLHRGMVDGYASLTSAGT